MCHLFDAQMALRLTGELKGGPRRISIVFERLLASLGVS